MYVPLYWVETPRTDKLVNLTAGALILVCLGLSASGYHKLQNGYGKKDGF